MFGVKESLIADFKRIDDPVEAKALNFINPFWSVNWDFLLAPAKAGVAERTMFHVSGH